METYHFWSSAIEHIVELWNFCYVNTGKHFKPQALKLLRLKITIA